MAEFTLLKLELEEGSLTANAPFSGRSSPGEEDEADEEAGGGRSLRPLVVGLVFLVAVSLAVRKLRSGSEDTEEYVESEAETAL